MGPTLLQRYGAADAFAFSMSTASNLRARAALSNWNWAAIAAGVVIALSSQILLLWLGEAVVTSFGDKQPAGGFAVWGVVVQLGSLFLGAAFAAFLARPTFAGGGAAIGAFTWALALVLGSAIAARPFAGWRPENLSAAAWTTFIGALLSLGTAMLGGAFGGSRMIRGLVEPGGREVVAGREGEGSIVAPEHIVTVSPTR